MTLNMLLYVNFPREIYFCVILGILWPFTVRAEVSPVTVTTNSGVPISIDLDSSISGISNPDVTIVTQPANGIAVKTPDTTLSITYTSNGEFTGMDTFEYQVINDAGVAERSIISVMVGQMPEFGQSLNYDYVESAFVSSELNFLGLSSPIAGDLNGDNAADLIGYLNGQFITLMNDGTGQFSELQNANITDAIKLHDMDGNKTMDIVTASLEVWLNNGSGAFSLAQSSLNNEGIANIDIGDIDGDSTHDLVVVKNNRIQIWHNSGQGQLTEGHTLGGTSSNAVAIGDIDCDNDQDIIIATDTVDEIWINDGSGQFVKSAQVFDDLHSTNIQTGDLDGDSDLDLVVTHFNQSRVWLNSGNGNFVLNPRFNLTTDAAHKLHLVDLNNDERLDIITEALFPIENSFLVLLAAQLSAGNGDFIELPHSFSTINSGSLNQRNISIGNFNRDQYKDFLVITDGTSQLQLNNLENKFGGFLVATNPVERINLHVTNRLVTVLESDNYVIITIKPETPSTKQFRVDYSTLGHSAQANVDYVEASGSLSWQPGDDSEKTISIELIADQEMEFSEAFFLRLEMSIDFDQSLIQKIIMPAVIIYDEYPGNVASLCTIVTSTNNSENNTSNGDGSGSFSLGLLLLLILSRLVRLTSNQDRKKMVAN